MSQLLILAYDVRASHVPYKEYRKYLCIPKEEQIISEAWSDPLIFFINIKLLLKITLRNSAELKYAIRHINGTCRQSISDFILSTIQLTVIKAKIRVNEDHAEVL